MKILLILTLFLSYNPPTNAEEIINDNVSLEKAESMCDNKDEEPIAYHGSASMDKCFKILKTSDNINSALSGRTSIWNEPVAKALKCCESDKTPNCANNVKKTVQSCVSAFELMKSQDRSFDNPDHNQKIAPQQSSQAQQPQQQQSGVNVGGTTITCKSGGAETLDYEACQKFVNAYRVAEAATAVVHTGQQAHFQNELVDVQAEFIKNQDTATGALEAQKKALEAEKKIFEQRAVIDGAKLATLYTIYEQMPKPKDLTKVCDNMRAVTISPDIRISSKECQETAATAKSRYYFLQNQAARDAMHAQLLTAAMSLGNNAILAKLTGDRIKDANKAIAAVEEFTPTDPFEVVSEEEKTTLCQSDPTHVDCNNIGLSANYDALSDNVIVFGNTGTGTSYTGAPTAGEDDVGLLPGSESKSQAVESVGSAINVATKDSSMEGSSAATVTSKGNGSRGGGGGGGGGGAAGISGSPPPKPGEGGVTQAVASKAPNYGGGGGSLSVTGGLGINRKKSESSGEGNPFDKLFNKDKKESGNVNFRDIASNKVGDKKDNIFDMISNRYGSVNSQKRLLEYELSN